jgi:preprotein translocase subunit SecE
LIGVGVAGAAQVVIGFGRERRRAMANPFTFMQQVRAEMAKVVWPTRKETIVTTIMVLIMSTLAALFFLAADQVLGWAVGAVLQIGR